MALSYERNTLVGGGEVSRGAGVALQGYPAHKKHPPHRTLHKDYALGLMVVLGGGGLFLMSEVPL